MKIDEYAFDLFHFADLDKLADDNRYLIGDIPILDVVGKIQNLRTSLKSVKNEVEKNLTKFELSNGSSAVSVTLFDDFGKDFEDELNDFQQEDVYVIICAARVGRYEGLTNLTNYPATRIYINPRHYSIKELKNKIKTMEAEDAVSSPEEDEHIANMTVKDIKSLPEKFDKAKVRCKIEVTSVVEDSGWCYAKCTKCPKEIARENGVYKCGNCQRIIPYPDKRFRLCTLCSDCTGSVAIIFPDEEISRIIDKTVFDIEANAIKEKTQDKFPTILKQFENKKYTITLAINKTNLEEGSNVYDACEILDKIEAGGNHDPSRESNVSMDYQSTVNIKSDNEDTPHTGVSSNKTKTLQEVGPIAYDDQTAVPNKRARKGNAMHAYIPAKCSYDMERKLRVGTVYIIRNFTVQAYKDKDKFRCLRNDMQMVFTQETTVIQVEEKGNNIAHEAFDFYDHSELMPLTNQTTYLAGYILHSFQIHVFFINNLCFMLFKCSQMLLVS
ncbi:hypothetical protein ACET3Z_012246 [Daucus carota]